MSQSLFKKDPQAKLDYGFDWEDWLEENESISTSDWSVETDTGSSDDLIIASTPSPTVSSGHTTVWVKDGVTEKKYDVKNTIETDQGRIDERTLTIWIKQR